MEPRSDLTALDHIAATFAVSEALLLGLAFPYYFAPAFAQLYADFGGQLPAMTSVALKGWPAQVVALVLVALVVLPYGPWRASPVFRRRMTLFTAFFVGFVGSIVLFAAMYLPVVSISGQIR